VGPRMGCKIGSYRSQGTKEISEEKLSACRDRPIANLDLGTGGPLSGRSAQRLVTSSRYHHFEKGDGETDFASGGILLPESRYGIWNLICQLDLLNSGQPVYTLPVQCRTGIHREQIERVELPFQTEIGVPHEMIYQKKVLEGVVDRGADLNIREKKTVYSPEKKRDNVGGVVDSLLCSDGGESQFKKKWQ